MRRWLQNVDPAALAMVLGLLSLLLITPPWTIRWREFLPEEMWVRLTLAAAITAMVFRPRSRWAWTGLALAIIWNLSIYSWAGNKPWLATMPYWDWERLVICRELGTILLLVMLVFTLALSLRAMEPEVGLGSCAARAAIALAASVVVLTAADYTKLLTREAFLLTYVSRPTGDIIRVALFIIPAILFAGLLWRKFSGVVLWIGASLASIGLAALPAFYANKMNDWEYIPIALLAGAGPFWAWWKWRTTPQEYLGQGFEVLMKPIPL